MLNEVFSKINKPSPSGIVKGLLADGYELINHYGNTFVNCLHHPDYDDVVLVNIENDCAPCFYKYCMENPENPYLPRVHETVTFDGGSLTRMERLIALDHVDLEPNAKEVLEGVAPDFVRYIRGEMSATNMKDMAATFPGIESTAYDILTLSRKIYQNTGGYVLPFCDLKPDNIFLRVKPDKLEFVFGDPLFPGSGKNADNMRFMQQAYQAFGMPPLKEEAGQLNLKAP